MGAAAKAGVATAVHASMAASAREEKVRIIRVPINGAKRFMLNRLNASGNFILCNSSRLR
jgi:hypothetical protein